MEVWQRGWLPQTTHSVSRATHTIATPLPKPDIYFLDFLNCFNTTAAFIKVRTSKASFFAMNRVENLLYLINVSNCSGRSIHSKGGYDEQKFYWTIRSQQIRCVKNMSADDSNVMIGQIFL